MWVTSIFSLSHNVFRRLVPQGRKNQGLFGKGLSYDHDTSSQRGEHLWKVVPKLKSSGKIYGPDTKFDGGTDRHKLTDKTKTIRPRIFVFGGQNKHSDKVS